MSARENAIAGWGAPLPDWIAALADECDRTSQNKAAARIGYTPSSVSNLLRGKYAASTDAIEEQIRGVLMSETVECPALGNIGKDKCRTWRRRSADETLISTLRTTMRRACLKCPLNRGMHHDTES